MNWLPKLIRGIRAFFLNKKNPSACAPAAEMPGADSTDLTVLMMPSTPVTAGVSSSLGTEPSSQPKHKVNWLKWPVPRTTRSFRAYVVEPYRFHPQEHAQIFQSALESLLTPERPHVEQYVRSFTTHVVEPFDLITFPEAFLPATELVPILLKISNFTKLGCVHVGLRPNGDAQHVAGQHLFTVDELIKLVDTLRAIPSVCLEDLDPFSDWLHDQVDDDLFNIGCVFTIDAHQRMRVCLHPKMVRSQYESSPVHDGHMKEANLLTLVTLQPLDRSLLTVTVQPLICSDTLFLDTDVPNNRPLEALNAGSCFDIPPPDHVDIVSVATCTPQYSEMHSSAHLQWHPQFLESFLRAASDGEFSRHYNAVFILSNFGTFRKNPSGLSGAFLPVPPLTNAKFSSFVSVSVWARPPKLPNGTKPSYDWVCATGDSPLTDDWFTKGYVAHIDPFIKNTLAIMLGFTIDRFPRNASRWHPMSGLTNFQMRTATRNAETGEVVFRKEDKNV